MDEACFLCENGKIAGHMPFSMPSADALHVRGYYSKIVFLNNIILLCFQFFINRKKRDGFVLYILLCRYIYYFNVLYRKIKVWMLDVLNWYDIIDKVIFETTS